MNCRTQRKLLAIGLCGFLGLRFASPASAQIVPDSSLPIPSTVRTEGNAFVIEGGSDIGANLFHSFSEFSVPASNEAFFNNATSIQNIIGRVTGNSISNIDGLLRANGAANLFFINPNGIAFGPEARLDIGGSFVASSANSLIFADGSIFSALNNGSNPLLTVSAPVGLQLGAEPGNIGVAGIGHDIATDASFDLTENTSPGLQVAPNRTLALLGGNIALEGSILTAPSGRVELGGAADTIVDIIPVPEGFSLAYEEATSFQPIQLSQAALVEASGEGGTIQVRGESLRLTDSSTLLVEHSGTQPGGSIDIGVTGPIEVIGIEVLPDFSLRPSLIRADALGAGDGIGVALSASSVLVENGAVITSTNSGTGRGGNVDIAVTDFVRVFLSSDIAQAGIVASNRGPGVGGDVLVTARSVTLEDGGNLLTGTFGFGSGPSGNIIIDASESVEVMGTIPNTMFGLSSLLSSSSMSGSDSGFIEIDTQRLILQDGGIISTAAFAEGSAGSITIDAAESIEILATPGAAPSSTSIDSSTILLPEFQRQLFGLPDVPAGNAGSITLRTGDLTIENGGDVSVANQGMGNAGTLQVDAEDIRLEDGGAILASTLSGEGGNIVLNLSDRLTLQRSGAVNSTAGGVGSGGSVAIGAEEVFVLTGSSIEAGAEAGVGGNIAIVAEDIRVRTGGSISAESTAGQGGNIVLDVDDRLGLLGFGSVSATAGGIGNGGNIGIGADVISLLGGSSITANAFEGNGGNITIVTEGLFVFIGSSITASSEFGLDGTVEILEPNIDPAETFLQLPEEVTDIASLFAGSPCDYSEGSYFYLLGAGGSPTDPRDTPPSVKDSNDLWISAGGETSSAPDEPLVEARSWQHDRDGNVLLTATPAIARNCTSASR